MIQKIFESCSDETRLLMLERIAPFLASIGVHKNGTWAAQKIIEHANTPALVCFYIIFFCYAYFSRFLYHFFFSIYICFFNIGRSRLFLRILHLMYRCFYSTSTETMLSNAVYAKVLNLTNTLWMQLLINVGRLAKEDLVPVQ